MASKLNTSIIAKIFILRTATLAKERYPAIKDKKKNIYIYIYIYIDILVYSVFWY